MSDTQVEVKKRETPKETVQPPWDSFRSEFDQLFNRFSRSLFPWRTPAFSETSTPSFTGWLTSSQPVTDISEDNAAFTVTAELPGLTAADVEVSLNKDYLVIKGEKVKETRRDDRNYHLTERSHGKFERSFLVPDGVDREKISAEVAKGVLTVTLPKTEAARIPAKKIDVKSA